MRRREGSRERGEPIVAFRKEKEEVMEGGRNEMPSVSPHFCIRKTCKLLLFCSLWTWFYFIFNGFWSDCDVTKNTLQQKNHNFRTEHARQIMACTTTIASKQSHRSWLTLLKCRDLHKFLIGMVFEKVLIEFYIAVKVSQVKCSGFLLCISNTFSPNTQAFCSNPFHSQRTFWSDFPH